LVHLSGWEFCRCSQNMAKEVPYTS
jgi:hypothetical protein